MKVIPIALQNHYESGNLTVAVGLFLLRRDGSAYGFTSREISSVLDLSAWWPDSNAVAFELNASQGLSATDWVTTSGLDVSNAEANFLSTTDDGTFFDRKEVLQGLWTNAKYWVFRYDYATAEDTDDVEVISRGTLGEASVNMNTIMFELRDISQKLQQPVGIATQPTCRARLGDSRCKVDLTPWTHNFTVTSVSSDPVRRFTASAATQDDGHFDEGVLFWTSGENTGVEVKIIGFDSGEFTLISPMIESVEIGDTFTAIAGCMKRLEDCRDKFNNIYNMQAEPHVPNIDQVTKPENPNG